MQDHNPVTSPPSDPLDPPGTNSFHDDGPRISRRRFGQHAAVAAALSLSSAQLLAASHHPHRESPTGARSAPNSAADLTPEQTQEVEAKLANIVRKYGTRLSDEQRQHLRRILAYNEKMLASVRTFPLENGDPPASVLKISFAKGKP
jgi:hypothetical protein